MSAIRGDGRSLRRLVWLMVGLGAASLLLSLGLDLGGGASSRFTYGGSPEYPFYLVEILMLGFGALILLRQPRHLVGWLMLASATFYMLQQPLINYMLFAAHVPDRGLPGADLIGTVDQMAWVPLIVLSAIFLPLLFPTGRLPSRRWRPVVWIVVAASIATVLGGAFSSKQDPSSMPAGVRLVVAPPPLGQIADVVFTAIILLPAAVIAAVLSLGLLLPPRRDLGTSPDQVAAVCRVGLRIGVRGLPARCLSQLLASLAR